MRTVADLGAQVEDDHLDRAGLGFHGGDTLLDAVGLDGIEQEAGCGAAVLPAVLFNAAERRSARRPGRSLDEESPCTHRNP